MHHRSDWRGWLVCTVVSLLLALPGTALAAGGGEHGGGGLINLDKSLIVQLINFIILLIILQRFLYKGMQTIAKGTDQGTVWPKTSNTN